MAASGTRNPAAPTPASTAIPQIRSILLASDDGDQLTRRRLRQALSGRTAVITRFPAPFQQGESQMPNLKIPRQGGSLLLTLALIAAEQVIRKIAEEAEAKKNNTWRW